MRRGDACLGSADAGDSAAASDGEPAVEQSPLELRSEATTCTHMSPTTVAKSLAYPFKMSPGSKASFSFCNLASSNVLTLGGDGEAEGYSGIVLCRMGSGTGLRTAMALAGVEGVAKHGALGVEAQARRTEGCGTDGCPSNREGEDGGRTTGHRESPGDTRVERTAAHGDAGPRHRGAGQ